VTGSTPTTAHQCEGVVLLGFGGPVAPVQVRPFLERVLAGRPVPRERYEEVVRHYEAMGGRSPYNDLTMRQAKALQEEFERAQLRVPVLVGFRHIRPFFEDALRVLQQRGIRRALGFVLAAHRCEASWDRYLEQIRIAREHLGSDAPEIEYPALWHDDSGFIKAVADRTRAALHRLTDSTRGNAELIFTAHSIPLAMGGRAAYLEQLQASARAVAERLGRESWTLAFQSRSGNPHEPWLEPDLRDVLRGLAGGAAVVVPLGFLCDHVEVLYDLDIDAARVAREAGVTMQRAATVSDHPDFVKMIAAIARSHLSPALVSR
jgi:protoporphyrin/coproporphyrin ferrochelatase